MAILKLDTERLILRPIDETDAVFRFNLFKNDNNLFGCDPYKNQQHALDSVKGFAGINKTGFQYHWTILLKEDQSRVGFFDAYLPAPHMLALAICEISYGISNEHRGKGYMNEIFPIVVDFLTTNQKFHRLEANVSSENIGSKKLLEKFGFKLEGTRRSAWRWGESWHDMNLYGLLSEPKHTIGC